jgi:hypothetical protein
MAMNSSMAENFMRSAKAPAISAGVMMAKVSWKVTNTVSGTVPVRASIPTPRRKALSRPPTKELRFVTPASMPLVSKARLYPQMIQMRVTMPVRAKHCISTDSTFFERTRPP